MIDIPELLRPMIDDVPETPNLHEVQRRVAHRRRHRRRATGLTAIAVVLVLATVGVAVARATPAQRPLRIETAPSVTGSTIPVGRTPPQLNTTGLQVAQAVVLNNLSNTIGGTIASAEIKTMPYQVLDAAMKTAGMTFDEPNSTWTPVAPTNPVDAVVFSGHVHAAAMIDYTNWVILLVDPTDGDYTAWWGSNSGTWPDFYDALPNTPNTQTQLPTVDPPLASEHPTLQAGSYTGIAPEGVYFSRDDSNLTFALSWTTWNATEAVGHGWSYDQTCTQTCTTINEIPATLTLSQPVNGHFTKIVETRNGRQQTFTFPTQWPVQAIPPFDSCASLQQCEGTPGGPSETHRVQ